MERKERQRLVDREASNAQMVQFVADRQAEIASQADAIQAERPELAADMTEAAALEREHRKTLMEMAREQKRLATDIQLQGLPADTMAAALREHRKDMLEMAREEGHLAETLKDVPGDDPTLKVLAEQAERNRQLLRQAAKTESDADRALRSDPPSAK